MSKATGIRATLQPTFGWNEIKAVAGAFCYTFNDAGEEVGIVHSCPCGCGCFSGVYFAPSTSKVLWNRSGTREAPTFSPSIGIHPQEGKQDVEADGYHWHGHLVEGIWTSV